MSLLTSGSKLTVIELEYSLYFLYLGEAWGYFYRNEHVNKIESYLL